MNALNTLPLLPRTVFAALLFTAVIGETALFIYRTMRSVHFAEQFASLLPIIITLSALIFFPWRNDADTGFCKLPWISVVILLLLAALHLSLEIPIERKRLTEHLTSESIREATNNLKMGVCFADPTGLIILCNVTMRELTYMILGVYPRMIDEIDAMLFIKKTEGEESSTKLYFFPDGSIRQFSTRQITVSGEEGWRQIIADDVTDLYRVREKLEDETRRLTETNRRLRAMYDRMTDDIREKESLEMKVRVHDTMGRSLITIQDIMKNPDKADKKLIALKEAVSLLSNPPVETDIANEIKNCEKLGVRLILRGYLPKENRTLRIVVAAIRECATNCVKHAHGSYVAVDIQERFKMYSITITNDGEKPKGKIIEGSGLSSLRQSVESIGGEMLTAYSPRFALLLNLLTTEEDI